MNDSEVDLLGEAELLQTPSNTDTRVKNLIGLPPGMDKSSPEWSDFVMTQFVKDELSEEGLPYAHGLRRVAALLLGGPPMFSGVTQVFPVDKDARATVVWRVDFPNGTSCSDVADSFPGNSDDAFIPFAVACAATRAEARALRKALFLRKVAAEETTNRDVRQVGKAIAQFTTIKGESTGEYEEKGSMTDAQGNCIDKMCRRLDINPQKLFTHVVRCNDTKVSKSNASQAIDELNKFQANKTLIDESIRGFKDDWRS